MELKRELLEWYNAQLEEKNIFIISAEELSSGYVFLEVLQNFHHKTVDLSKAYIKPKNEYEVLQNYKHLLACFGKIGWKKFDPERYAKRKEKDYLSLAQTLKKILSSRSIRESRLQSSIGATLEEFGGDGELEGSGQDYAINANIARLEKTKKELLSKIGRVQEELWAEGPGEDG
jgi:hypothetical protein